MDSDFCCSQRFLFYTSLCWLHYHITGLILGRKKDASLAVKTTEGGGRQLSTGPNMCLLLPTRFFFLSVECEFDCGIRSIFKDWFRAESAVLFLSSVFSLLLISDEVWD